MTTGIHISTSSAHPKAVQVLAIVAATVPLPKATAAALRLVCRATKLAVDDSVKELCLRNDAAKRLRARDNPLTAGLTALRLVSDDYSRSSLFKICSMALNSSKSLQSLIIYPDLENKSSTDAHVALGMLRTCSWPNLQIFHMLAVPRIFSSYIPPNSMPKLTELHLNGALSSRDIAALHAGRGLAARLEVLELGPCNSDQNSSKFYDLLEVLLNATPKLRALKLQAERCRDLSFLAAPELLSLEILQIFTFHSLIKLEYSTPFTPKPRLHTLKLAGSGAAADMLRALLSRSETLPVLQNIITCVEKCDDWVVLRQMDLPTLKSLKIDSCLMTLADVGQVGAMLARLPALESFEFAPCGADEEGEEVDDTIFEGASAIWTLLSTAGALPHLRRLLLGGDLEYRDSSIACLITHAESMPQMAEIVMAEATITAESIARLAGAGTGGRWPLLKLFHARIFEDPNLKFYSGVLRGVWPGLVVKIGAVGGE